MAVREYSGGFVAANPLPQGSPPVRVELPQGKSYRVVGGDEIVKGHLMLLARNATVLLLA